MEQFKKAKVVLIPTEKYSNIILNHNNKLQFNDTKYIKSYQQLLIISDDEIKEGNWFLNTKSNAIGQHNGSRILLFKEDRKIIASYPLLKIKCIESNNGFCGKGTCDYPSCKYQPQPSQQFIEQYIESYNKGEVITDVLVEYIGNLKVNSYHENGDPNKSDSHYIFYPKINPDNTITIKPVKDSWDREEMFKLMDDYQDYLFRTNEPVKTFKEWFNQNL